MPCCHGQSRLHRCLCSCATRSCGTLAVWGQARRNDGRGGRSSGAACAVAHARGAAYTLRRLRCPRDVTVPGVKREAGAHANRVQGRRCPRNGKRERYRDKPLCLRHGKARSAGDDPLASPETGRDTFGRLALGEARSIAMPPAIATLCLLLSLTACTATATRVERVREWIDEGLGSRRHGE